MTRWEEDGNYDEYDHEEEARLVKKLNEYLDLEKSEKIKKESQKIKSSSKKGKIWLAIVEGTILVGLASAFLIMLYNQ